MKDAAVGKICHGERGPCSGIEFRATRLEPMSRGWQANVVPERGRIVMARIPKIPMRPEELPQQRITLVASLPPRPAGFVGKREPPESVPLPARMPRSAKYVGQFEWAWGPNNSLLVAYYLSTNRERTHWLLWVRPYDDNWGKWDEPQVQVYAPKQNVPAKTAAAYLLLDSWTEEIRESSLDHFHWINKVDFLSVEELHAIGRVVWPNVTNACIDPSRNSRPAEEIEKRPAEQRGRAVDIHTERGTLCVVTSGEDVAPGVSAGHVVRFIRAPIPGTAVAVFQYAPGVYAFSHSDKSWVGKDNAHYCCLINRTRLRLLEPWDLESNSESLLLLNEIMPQQERKDTALAATQARLFQILVTSRLQPGDLTSSAKTERPTGPTPDKGDLLLRNMMRHTIPMVNEPDPAPRPQEQQQKPPKVPKG